MVKIVRGKEGRQGTDEWLEFRKFKIGSSDAASIMGCGFKTPLQLFDEHWGSAPKRQANQAMKRGSAMEVEARDWLNAKYGIDLIPVVAQNPSCDWHISSMDGLYISEKGDMFACEIKCPGEENHQLALDGVVPPIYIPQCYHILETSPDLERILYLSYTPESQAEIWVYRDEVEMEKQLQKEEEFYQTLINCVPPMPTHADWTMIKEDEYVKSIEEYVRITNEVGSLEKKASEIKERLVEMMESRDCRRAIIGSINMQRICRKGNVRYSDIPELIGVDLDQYRARSTVSYRVG